MIPLSLPTPIPQAISTHHQLFPVPKMDVPPPQPVTLTLKETLYKIGHIPKVLHSNHIDKPAPSTRKRPATPLSDVYTSIIQQNIVVQCLEGECWSLVFLFLLILIPHDFFPFLLMIKSVTTETIDLGQKTLSIVRGVGSGLISINRMPRTRYCLC